jgi:uncharacterized lipoprotein YmbA
MHRRRRIIYPLVAVGLIVLLGGCFGSTPPSRFYTLSPREDTGISASGGVSVFVRLGPVNLPSYLDRRQIVTRSGQNEILLAEYERWGGSLDDEITRLLVNGLTVRLAPKGIAVAPWTSVPMAEAATLYRIPISIDRFDGAPGETVFLNATWAVIKKKDRGENPLVVRESTITEKVAGTDYASLVAAMGKAVDKLGNEIAESLAALNE